MEENLYKAIKYLREKKGLSQQELADITGYTSRSTIAKIEKGEIDLPQSKIMIFANALNTTPGKLMGWDEKKLSATKEDINSSAETATKSSIHDEILKIKPFNDIGNAMKFIVKYNIKIVEPTGFDNMTDEEIIVFVNSVLHNTQEIIKTTIDQSK